MPGIKPPRISLPDRLGMAMKSCGLTLRQMSRQSGVSTSRLCRFLNGEDMRLKTADKVCAVLGLELVQTRAPRSMEQ
jgi:hypothetical protein